MNGGAESNQDKEFVSPAARSILTVLILIYLSIVLLGPLSNPISSANLTDPLARKIAPVHQAMFLGHGYRFFGPDPGPSHILEYEITKQDNSKFTGKFPDRELIWPRLRYHRWFMLSETIYEESLGLVDEQQHAEMLDGMNVEIEELRLRNERATMDSLVREREQTKENNSYLEKRIGNLLNSLAQSLLAQHGGDSIELKMRERLIARPVDVQSRVKLTDRRFLSDPKSLGTFTARTTGDMEEVN